MKKKENTKIIYTNNLGNFKVRKNGRAKLLIGKPGSPKSEFVRATPLDNTFKII